MRERVGDFDDPRLDHFRNVPDPTLLSERRLFVAEGRLVVSRLLGSARFAIRSLMLTRTAADAMADALAARPDLPVYEVEQATMNRVAGFNLHRGCLAVGERPDDVEVGAITADARRIVALEGVGNADNVGSIFRNAAALGGDGVLLDRACADPLYRKALRTSMGAALQVPFARTEALVDTLLQCRRAGMQLVALTPASGAPSLREAAASLASARLVIVVGHEGDGLSAEVMDACDLLARIPMHAGVDSLNVATAAAIALYEVGSRQ